MRFLPLALVGAVALSVAGCGLDPNGLGDVSGAGDDGAPTVGDDGPGNLTTDGANNGGDTTVPADDGPGSTGETGGGDGGTDGTVAEDGGDGGGSKDAHAGDGSELDAMPIDGGTDAKPVDAGKDSAAEDAGTDATAAGDSGVTDGSPSDAAGLGDAAGSGDADPVDACGATEICNNGIDDNCDGKIDCQDPQCTPGWTCTGGLVPTGWTLISFDETGRPGCSSGYNNPLSVVDDVSAAPASCTCPCEVTAAGSCQTGQYSAAAGTGGVLGGCGLASQPISAGNGACTRGQAYTPPPGAKLQIGPAPYAPGTCSASAGTTLPPASENKGQVCKETEATGGGCSSGAVCAPTPSSALVCIARDGAQLCPSGFPTTYTVGGGVDDTRKCSSCSCTGTTGSCENPQLTLYADVGCNPDAGTVNVTVDGQCDDVPPSGGLTFNAYVYTAQVQNESCGSTTSTASGGVALTGTRTICCP